MNRSFAILLFVGGAMPLEVLAAPVDLTPHVRELQREEGGPQPQVFFKHGKKNIVFCPPTGWTATGGPEMAVFFAKGASTARAQIRHQEGSAPPTWDEPCLKALREQATALTSPAVNPKLLGESRSPFLIENHETMAYTFSGVLQYRECKFFVLLLFLDKEQFSFTMCSDSREFETAYEDFRTSLFRLCWVDDPSQK